MSNPETTLPLWRCAGCQKMEARRESAPLERCMLCGATDWQAVREAPPPDAVHPADEWHEDHGPVLWWHLDEWGAIAEPPIVCFGTELEYQEPWPGYYSHWSPLPVMPRHPVRELMLAPEGTLICDGGLHV